MDGGFRCHRVPVPAELRGPGTDYASAFALTPIDPATPTVQWARSLVEAAPRPLRALVLAWWRWGLRLQLQPAAPTNLLGWEITEATQERVTLRAASPLVVAFNDVLRQGGRLVWVTRVTYRQELGHLLWMLAAPVHQALLPRLLLRASRPR